MQYIFAVTTITFTVEASDSAITKLEFTLTPLKKETSSLPPLVQKLKTELQEYFAGSRTNFTVPYHIQGTPFQKRVWHALAQIPFGKTMTYKEIATQAGSPKAFRAVGTACGSNPIPMLIPCHRVLGSHGLGGFSSDIRIKSLLLEFEKRQSA